jgi:hypothetical protein
MRRAGRVLLALAVLGPLAAWAFGAALGEEVTLLHRRNDAAEEAEARRLRDPRDDPAHVYGSPEPGRVRVLFPDAARRVVPVEDPTRVLLHVDRVHGETVLDARTLLVRTAAVALLLGLAGAGLLLAARRRTAGRLTPPGE